MPGAEGDNPRQLDILVNTYGHVNFGRFTTDRKGILGDVVLNGEPLLGWQMFGLPLDDAHLRRMRGAPAGARPGLLHQASVELAEVGDTFIDMTGWSHGYVWINDQLLGRYCAPGPQTKLFCPATWLRRGSNRITILDLRAPGGRMIGAVRQSDLDLQRIREGTRASA